MDTQVELKLPDVDMGEELQKTVHHICGMLRSVKRLKPNSAAAAVSTNLEKHLKALKPSDVGLPAIWNPEPSTGGRP